MLTLTEKHITIHKKIGAPNITVSAYNECKVDGGVQAQVEWGKSIAWADGVNLAELLFEALPRDTIESMISSLDKRLIEEACGEATNKGL